MQATGSPVVRIPPTGVWWPSCGALWVLRGRPELPVPSPESVNSSICKPGTEVPERGLKNSSWLSAPHARTCVALSLSPTRFSGGLAGPFAEAPPDRARSWQPRHP